MRHMADVAGVIKAPRMEAYVADENRNEPNVFKPMSLARDEESIEGPRPKPRERKAKTKRRMRRRRRSSPYTDSSPRH